jgi:hypothetical protein
MGETNLFDIQIIVILIGVYVMIGILVNYFNFEFMDEYNINSVVLLLWPITLVILIAITIIKLFRAFVKEIRNITK